MSLDDRFGPRVVVMAGAGAAATATLRLLPGDPLAASLAVLPPVVALLYLARRSTGLAAAPQTALRLAAAAALVGSGLTLDTLGLRWGTALGHPTIVAALYVLLFWQATATVADLGASPAVRSGDGPAGRRTGSGLAMVLFAVYLGILPWSTGQRPPDGDEPYYLLLTHSLAYDFDADLANNYEQGDSLAFMPRLVDPQPGDPTGSAGQIYSRHNMTLPLVLALPYRLAGAQGVFVVMAALSVLLIASCLRLAREYFPELREGSVAAAGLAGLAPPVLLFSHQVWAEVPAALLLAIGWQGLLERRRGRTGFNPLAKIVLAALLLPLVKLRLLALAAPLLLLAATHARSRDRGRMLLVIGVAVASMLAAIVWFNLAVFGSPLKYHSLLGSLLAYSSDPSLYLRAPAALLLDSAFGLLLTAPLWLLVIPALGELGRKHRHLVVDGLVIYLPYLLLLGPRGEWYGGWSPPFRYGIVFIPFLTLLLVPLLERRHDAGVRFLLGLLGAASVTVTIVWLAVPGWTYNFGDGRSLLLDHLSRTLDSDVARFFPSFIRPRVANWIWFLLVLPLLFAVGWRWRRRAVRNALGWGVAAYLVAGAALARAATRLPLRTVEFEDPYVTKVGGQLHPELWAVNRPRYRGSWMVSADTEVSVDLQSSGERLALEIDYRRLGPRQGLALSILADSRLLTTVPIPPAADWSTLAVEELEWPAGASRLTLRLDARPPGRLLLDRARISWQ